MGGGAPAFQTHPHLTFLNCKPRAWAWLQTELFPFLSRRVPGLAEISGGLPSLSLYFCSPGFVSRAWSSSSTVCPRSLSILPWLMIYVRERSTAATEANQRKFLPVRAEKVQDGFSCPHFQLCLEVWFPGAVSVCSQCLLHWFGERTESHWQGFWLANSEKLCTRIIPPFFPLPALPWLFCKQNITWASPSLEGNSGVCLAYLYGKTHHLYTLPPLPTSKLLHRNIPWFSEFINLFPREWIEIFTAFEQQQKPIKLLCGNLVRNLFL